MVMGEGLCRQMKGVDEMKKSIRLLIADDHMVVRQGLCAFLSSEPDVEVVGEVRRAVGPEIEITVDANQGYASPKLATRTILRMCEFGISMAEQPVEGLDGMAEVRGAVPCLVMADESAWTPHDILEIKALGAIGNCKT